MEKNMTLGEALKLEYLIAYNVYTREKNDFLEGVRSVIIEKDGKPKWKPASVEECQHSEIESVFKKKVEFEELTFKN